MPLVTHSYTHDSPRDILDKRWFISMWMLKLLEVPFRFYFVTLTQLLASSQFFDKFNARFYAQNIIRYIWKLPTYAESFNEAFAYAQFLALLTDS